MPKTKKIDSVMLDRIRTARAVEDTALAAVTAAQATVDAAVAKRAGVLAALDVSVDTAEADLALAYAELAAAAGIDRAARTLDMSSAALRKRLPCGWNVTEGRTAVSPATTVSAGGAR